MIIRIVALLVAVIALSFNACSGKGYNSAGGGAPTVSNVPAGANVLPVSVGCGYFNEPCVTVTICQPGTGNCQSIPNVLLDTGSYGLRLFLSVIHVTLNNVTNAGGQPYAECTSYADGTSDWGPVRYADVKLASEVASNIPIQVIDSTFPTAPSDCTDLDTSPADEGFNGILGVGLFGEDCGTDCTTLADNRIYFVCSGSTCSSTAAPLAVQVVNPVPRFNGDNNGMVLTMNTVAPGGAASDSGALIFGIGTQSNNTVTATQTFTADKFSEFSSTFNGKTYSESFIDSGSNAIYFPNTVSGLNPCTGDYAGFYCPASVLALSGVQVGRNGQSATAAFSVGNASTDGNSNNYAFADLAGEYDGGVDWGLPFFFGRKIYLGLDGRSSSLGSGAFWAY